MEQTPITQDPSIASGPQGAVINLTVNVSGLLTHEALELINEKVEEAIAQALDEARRLQSDVKR